MYDLPINHTSLWVPVHAPTGKLNYALRSFVREWCNENLDHPVTLVTRRATTYQLIARFHNEAEALHFKTRWWGA